MLLAPRKTALALMRWQDLHEEFDQDNKTTLVWETPHELIKAKKKAKARTYVTPLPARAMRILKGLPRTNERVFPSLDYNTSPAGQRVFKDSAWQRRLVLIGAPKDFHPHAARHTVTSWLKKEGKRSLWECSLVLNHADSGTTAGYLHTHATKLKLEILGQWAAHIERLVEPSAGVTRLRG